MKKVFSVIVIMSLIFTMSACSSGGENSDGKADIAISNGLVYTVDEKATEAQAVAIKDDEIIYVGDEEGLKEWIGDDTKKVDLDGGMALPGFIDSHGHPALSVNELYTLDLSDGESQEDYIKLIRDYMEKNPDLETIVGYGWTTNGFGGKSPNKKELDEISTEIPIVMADEGQHIRWMNSKALEVAGINKDTKIPDGANVEKDSLGEPSGLVADYPGLGDIFSEYTVEQFKEGIKYFQEEIGAPTGITSAFDDSNRSMDECIKAYNEMEKSDKLTMRINFFMRDVDEDNVKASVDKIATEKENTEGGLFNIGGIKIFMDGVLEGHTAYMEEEYIDDEGGHGKYSWKGKDTELNELCDYGVKKNLTLHFHAIGDAAVAKALDSIEYAKSKNENDNLIHAITHVQFAKENDVKRFADMNVSMIPQAFWLGYDEYYDQAVEYVGQKLADEQYPLESFFKNNVLVASGSDYPVQTCRPLDAMEIGVTRKFPGEAEDSKSLPPDSEKATIEEMIQSYTINGAKANYLDNQVGSLEVGKKADIVILDKNLLEVKPTDISKTKELMTIFNGKVVFESK